MDASTDWREIPGFPGYEVSRQGAVRSWKLRGPHHLKRASKPHQLAATLSQHGSAAVNLFENGREQIVPIDLLLALAWDGAERELSPIEVSEIRALEGHRSVYEVAVEFRVDTHTVRELWNEEYVARGLKFALERDDTQD